MKILAFLLLGWTGMAALCIGSVNILAGASGGAINGNSAVSVALFLGGMSAVGGAAYWLGTVKSEVLRLRKEVDGLHTWRHVLEAKHGGRRKSDVDK